MQGRKQGTVLGALKDIEGLFEFGGEIRPFLEELFTFLSDLMPILAKANKSLETTTSSIGSASENIVSAEMMAQNATHTIMDNVDHITNQLDSMILTEKDDETKTNLEDLAQKVAEIHIALQFQDITSQHLQQAMQIVEAIQVRLDKMFHALEKIGEENEAVKKIMDKYTADSDVEDIDIEDTIRQDDTISQADIDALFGK